MVGQKFIQINQPYTPQTLVAVQTHDRILSVLQQQRVVALAIGHKREFTYRQGTHTFPVRNDDAQVTTIIVEIVFTLGRRDRIGRW